MSTHTTERRSAAPSYPDARPVGPHLVIDRAAWRSGRDPTAGERESGAYYCLSCGVERRDRRAFSDVCDGPPPDGR